MSPVSAKNGKQPKSKPQRIIWAVGGILGLSVILTILTLLFGHVRGEEFSPYTFKCRSFSYYRIPLTEIQVRPIKYEPIWSDLRAHLSQNNLLPKSGKKSDRWDLVYRRCAGKREPAYGDAQFLCHFIPSICQAYRVDNDWLKWTRQHPKMAAVLWPAVAELAQANLYIYLPDLLELAEKGDEPDALEDEIDLLLAARYRELAQIYSDEGRPNLAKQFLEKASAHGTEQANLEE